jgi:hypothetical protein
MIDFHALDERCCAAKESRSPSVPRLATPVLDPTVSGCLVLSSSGNDDEQLVAVTCHCLSYGSGVAEARLCAPVAGAARGSDDCRGCVDEIADGDAAVVGPEMLMRPTASTPSPR